MKNKFIFIAGPCVIESRDKTLKVATYLKNLTSKLNLQFIFKASFDKANRTSLKSYRGPGLKKGLAILSEIKKKLKVLVLSDVHSPEQVKVLGDTLDIIQIPAFLCRQTDLIVAAAKTKKIINIKKGQFLSPYDLKYIIDKVKSTGNKKIFLTERGSCFGYNNLVVDFRSFLIMKNFKFPVIYDVTHSLQRPSLESGISGGDKQFAKDLALSAVACGVDGLFMEVHPDPKKALSDKYTSLPLRDLKPILTKALKIREVISKK